MDIDKNLNAYGTTPLFSLWAYCRITTPSKKSISKINWIRARILQINCIHESNLSLEMFCMIFWIKTLQLKRLKTFCFVHVVGASLLPSEAASREDDQIYLFFFIAITRTLFVYRVSNSLIAKYRQAALFWVVDWNVWGVVDRAGNWAFAHAMGQWNRGVWPTKICNRTWLQWPLVDKQKKLLTCLS